MAVRELISQMSVVPVRVRVQVLMGLKRRQERGGKEPEHAQI